VTITNPYCAALGIPIPRVETACSSPDANYYGLLLVALLERGAPLTLEQAAVRFEEAGVAPAPEALASLKRCKPARPPIYRDGEHYSLDPHDDETELTLHQFLKEANTRRVSLDVVVGSVPGWTDPWSRARQAFPATDAWGWPSRLVDEQGYEIPRADVQLARFSDHAECAL